MPESDGRETFYVTTAIAYMNGFPHIGHAYEFISADAIARLHRMLGYDTFFLTGADEHGQKVEASAAKMGRAPQVHCDEYVSAFDKLNNVLGVSNDDYVRTTEERHKKTARKLWEMCAASDDIYLHNHEGWYNEREECFVTESDAALTDFKDPGTGVDYKRVSEETYFFRMSKYRERLIAHIEEFQTVEPESARNELLARLRHPDGLRDVCISRTTFKWGISVPESFDQKHIMYVWFDALSNYLTGVGALDPDNELSRFWPADKHIIGKDIKWFHCVIWPTMLMSAGLPVARQCFSHGFVNAADGRKMSKSYNNTIDPNEIIAKYPLDTIRYYMLAAATYGADLNFSEVGLISNHNAELADCLGNLVHRAVSLCGKYCGGQVPDTTHDAAFPLPFDLQALVDETPRLAQDCGVHALIGRAMQAVRDTNKFLTETEPWKMKGENAEERRKSIVRTTMEAIYAFSHFLAPVMPFVAEKVFEKLGTPPRALFLMNTQFYNLTPGTPVSIGDILFSKIETEEEKAAAAAKAAGGAGVGASGAAMGVKAKAKAAAEAEDPNQVDFTKMDIRVGEITKCWNHEAADKLFCEEINCGPELGTREVASGLRGFYSLDEMRGRRVLVVCNLKAAKMVGFESAGMVLAAKSADGSAVQLLEPPAGAELGERVCLEGVTGAAWSASRIAKKKVWATVAESLKTDAGCVATWAGQALLTSAGPCTVPSLASVPIS